MGARATIAAVLAATAVAAGAAATIPSAGAGAPSDDEELIVGAIPQRPLEPGEGATMRAAGIEWARLWLSWGQVESRRGTFDWSRADALVRDSAEQGLSALAMLFGTPQWAAAQDGNVCVDGGCLPYGPASDTTREAFARFAGAAVRRYGPGGSFWANNERIPYRPITAWQLWNEQNMHAFWRPRADPGAYGELLVAVERRIREADPNATVVLGGMFGPESRDGLIARDEFLAALYDEPEVAASFDAVAIHPYSGSALGALAQIRAVRTTIAANGDGEPLWVTEVGWASGGRHGHDLVKDKRKQARLLRRMFSRFVAKREAWNLEAAFWFAWRDSERGAAVCAWCARSGLIARSGAEKPSYRMMRRVVGGG